MTRQWKSTTGALLLLMVLLLGVSSVAQATNVKNDVLLDVKNIKVEKGIVELPFILKRNQPAKTETIVLPEGLEVDQEALQKMEVRDGKSMLLPGKAEFLDTKKILLHFGDNAATDIHFTLPVKASDDFLAKNKASNLMAVYTMTGSIEVKAKEGAGALPTVSSSLKTTRPNSGGVSNSPASSGDYIVKVKVLDYEGNPLPGAEVTINDSNKTTKTTDDFGMVEFSGLSPQIYSIKTYKIMDKGHERRTLTVTAEDFAQSESTKIVQKTVNMGRKVGRLTIHLTFKDVNGKVIEKAPLKDVSIDLKNGREVIDTFTLNKDNAWTKTYEDMVLQDDESKEVAYTLVQSGLADGKYTLYGKTYKVEVTSKMEGNKLVYSIVNQEVNKNGTTNPVETKETRIIKVEKKWLDHSKRALSNVPVYSVKVHLYGDGVDTGKEVLLTKDNNWKAEFAPVRRYKSEGSEEEVKYTVKEVGENNGYIYLNHTNYAVTVTGNAAEGFAIANTAPSTYTPTYGSTNYPYSRSYPYSSPYYNTSLPRTGDGLDVMIYVGAGLIAGVSLLVYGLIKKRYEKEI